MKLWPSSRCAVGVRLLHGNPVLLLAGTHAEGAVERLVREWNPRSALPQVADGVRWAGPFRLDDDAARESADPSLTADGRWSTAYAARAARSRRRVPDGLDAHLLRLRYPHGIPTGDEAVAWSLVMGLARRLDGAVRLPARSPRGACAVVPQRPQAQENSYCVYGPDPLPWPVLLSVLSLSLPELDHNGTHQGAGYCLDRPGGYEVRVRPLRRSDFIPYALRPHIATGVDVSAGVGTDAGTGTDAAWPRTTYRFRCRPQRTELDARRIDGLLRAAACQLADVVGGILLDGDGFPLMAAGSVTRR